MSHSPTPASEILLKLLQRSADIEQNTELTPHIPVSSLVQEVETSICALEYEHLSALFVDAALFASSCVPLLNAKIEHKREHKEKNYPDFVARAFQRELSSIQYLAPLMQQVSSTQIKSVCTMADIILDTIAIETRKPGGTDAFHRFLRKTFELIQKLTLEETKRIKTRSDNSAQSTDEKITADSFEKNPDKTPEKNKWLEHSVYRAFDRLDEVLGIDYGRDKGMRVDPKNYERLYEGAGLGVQSSYTSLLIALDELNPQTGARLIDLGSGYGRVGLLVGIVRPDIEFTGYEYVPHRVEAAQNSALQAGLSGHVSFLTQDLADTAFEIPDADIYYMYDPFSQETYQHVFKQLISISKRRKVAIVTKGNAGAWIANALTGGGWTSERTGDAGTLGIFRST